MFLWTKKKTPFPTGTGQFIMNIDWWFWDDAETPGLMTGEGLSQAAKEALTEAEWGRFCVLLVIGRVHSTRPLGQATDADGRLLFAKIGRHLMEIREKDSHRFSEYVIPKWTSINVGTSMLNVFKAYINVLEGWGYQYHWQSIKNARDEDDGVLLLSRGTPTHRISPTDVKEIVGLPHDFSVWMNGVGYGHERIPGGMWRFNYNADEFDLSHFNSRERKA